MKRELGIIGEELAEKYLLSRGYNILMKNFRSRFGEIDIIAYDVKAKTTVFVEVRTKTSDLFGRAEESITAAKREHLFKTALFYLAKHKVENVRFDLIAVNTFSNESINHLENVFEM